MVYDEARDPARSEDPPKASQASLFNTASSAKALVRQAEYNVASALPRRVIDDVLADTLGVPTDVLRAAFARVHGASIYRALLKFRVKLVDLTLASDPELSPRAVAQVCGFGYFGRFHQIYRRDTGRSPEASSTRDLTGADMLQRARAAVAATVARVFEGIEATTVSGEARSVDAAPAASAPAVASLRP